MKTKMKDYICKCGCNTFIVKRITKNGVASHTGLYCSYCGKWYKWLNKDERNLVTYIV